MNSITFTFGRFSPPTAGHEILFNKIKEQDTDTHMVFMSQTIDNDKNPLPFSDKYYYLSGMFPGVNFYTGTDLKTPYHALEELCKHYDKIRFVIGSDRVNGFKSMYQYAEQWGCKDFEIVVAANRDANNFVSASLARQLVKQGKYRDFCKCMPLQADKAIVRNMYVFLRKKLNTNNEKQSLKTKATS